MLVPTARTGVGLSRECQNPESLAGWPKVFCLKGAGGKRRSNERPARMNNSQLRIPVCLLRSWQWRLRPDTFMRLRSCLALNMLLDRTAHLHPKAPKATNPKRINEASATDLPLNHNLEPVPN